jgi:LacI family transcriptional regulator
LVAFQQALDEHGIGRETAYEFDGQFDYRSGYVAAERILEIETGKRPTAVVASNDLAAVGALQKLHEMKVRVPEDISIIGFDDIAMCQWVYPRLTTIRQEVIELTRFAAQLLLSRLAKDYAGEARIKSVAPRLIIRESTRDLRK